MFGLLLPLLNVGPVRGEHVHYLIEVFVHDIHNMAAFDYRGTREFIENLLSNQPRIVLIHEVASVVLQRLAAESNELEVGPEEREAPPDLFSEICVQVYLVLKLLGGLVDADLEFREVVVPHGEFKDVIQNLNHLVLRDVLSVQQREVVIAHVIRNELTRRNYTCQNVF